MFSPDGQWVTYLTTSAYAQPRNPEVYVQPFPATGVKQLIHSGGGGIHPMWSRDGRQLLFSYPVEMMAVNVTSTHPVFKVTPPVQFLASPRIDRPWPAPRNYDMTLDGRLIGIIQPEHTPQPIAPQIRIVLNWLEELKQRVPVK